MKDSYKTKGQLLEELSSLRSRVEELEREKVGYSQTTASTLEEGKILEKIFSTTHMLIACLDREFNFIHVNRAYAEADGRPPEFFIGQNHFALYPHPENESIFRRVVETGKPHTTYAKPFEYMERPELGVTNWDWTLHPVEGDSGDVTHLILCLVDVTERIMLEGELRKHHDLLEERVNERTIEFEREVEKRKRVERALRKEKERAQEYINIARVILIVLNSNQTIKLINKMGCEVLEYEEKDLIGKNWFDLAIPESEREKVRTGFKELIAGRIEVVQQFENPILTQNGKQRIIRWHNAVLKDDRGSIFATLSSGEDITDHKQAEEKIASLARFPRENPNPVLRATEDSTVIYTNKAGAVLLDSWGSGFGFPLPDDLGELVCDIIRSDESREFETQCGERTFLFMGSPIVEHRYVNLYGFDVTDRKNIEKALERGLEINTSVAELSRFLISFKTIDEISTLVLEHAKRLTDSPIGFVGYIDPQTGYLISPTLSREVWDTCQVKEKTFTFKEFRGLWGWVLENRKPLLTNTPSEHPASSGVPEGHVSIHRFLSAPSMADKLLMGQVVVANAECDYSSLDLEIVERLASLYALAIQRERERNEIQKARDNLEIRVAERTANLQYVNEQLGQEITVRKQAEAAVQAERRRLYSLLETLPVLICLQAPDYTFRFANRFFLKRFGEFKKRFCYELFYGQKDKCEWCQPIHTFQSKEPNYKESTLTDGRTYEMHSYPFQDIDGSQLILRLGIDITKRKQLEREILKISEREQRRIGQDLHDDLCQRLAGTATSIKALGQKLSAKSFPESTEVDEIVRQINQSMVQARQIAQGLFPVELEQCGLVPALKELALQTEQSFNISCLCRMKENIEISDSTTIIHLYRIAQESINNAVKHAEPSCIVLALSGQKNRIELRIDDDGIGLLHLNARRGSGKMGLRIMQYRTEILNGEFHAERNSHGGTSIFCSIPNVILGKKGDE